MMCVQKENLSVYKLNTPEWRMGVGLVGDGHGNVAL